MSEPSQPEAAIHDPEVPAAPADPVDPASMDEGADAAAAGPLDPSAAGETAVEPELEAARRQVAELEAALAKAKKKGKKPAKAQSGSSRGIETMFRTSYRTHIDLSSLADNKANIMISINGIIISILLASISPKVDANPWLMLPTSVLLIGSVASLIFAILAARPRVTSNMVNLEDVRAKRSNILFFGNFVTMEPDDFVLGMKETMGDADRLYTSMIRDIYALGTVLDRKFRLLRVAYNLFMAGLVAGVGLFLIVIAQVSMTANAVQLP